MQKILIPILLASMVFILNCRDETTQCTYTGAPNSYILVTFGSTTTRLLTDANGIARGECGGVQ